MKIHHCVLFLFLSFSCIGQQNIGLPAVTNYSKQVYGAGTQNWKVQQDAKGLLYFANNEGLLCFDGTFWKSYPLPNKTILRSIALGPQERIYVGGQDEIGYFSPGEKGNLVFTNLKELMPAEDRSFEDIWDITTNGDHTFFRVRQKIFHLNGSRISSFAGTIWRYMTTCNGVVYAQDLGKGLLKHTNGNFAPFIENDIFKGTVFITGIVAYSADTLLVSTLRNGLFLVAGSTYSPLKNIALEDVIQHDLISIGGLRNGTFALGTRSSGVYIIDKSGTPLYHYDAEAGLQNQSVISILADKMDNLWLGLDNGIDYVAHNDPIQQIVPNKNNPGSGYAAILANNNLLLGTNDGLYTVSLRNQQDIQLNSGPFERIAGVQGQVWSLNEINGEILMGHHEGAYAIKNNMAILKDAKTGYWTFLPAQNVLPASQIIAGTYTGVKLIETEGEVWKGEVAEKIFESSRFVVRDKENIWVSHPYKGVFRLNRKEGQNELSLKILDEKDGIANINKNYLFGIKNMLVAVTSDGLKQYDDFSGQFKSSTELDSLIPFSNIRYLKEDPWGNIWVVFDKNLAVIDFELKEPQIYSLPAFTNKMVSGFESIYFLNKTNTLIGGEKGFYLFNLPKYKSNRPVINPLIREVRLIGNFEKVIFEGFAFAEGTEQEFEIPPFWKNIHFDFSAPAFGQQQIVEYSFQLKGYEENWSAWTKRTDKEYTNLPPGGYTFLVRAKDHIGNISSPAFFNFTVLPPWYQTPWAYILYSIMLISLIFGLHNYQQKTILKAQKKHEEEQNKLKYLQQLEMDKAEKELVKLRNEKLETEIELQNAELASATMHLVQKAEIINGIKEEMLKITKNYKSEISIPELKKLIRTLGDDEAIDTGWDQFAQHFDKVHSNFHNTLKSKFPALTSGEMKLCTYLRMNLSSKEISQLLHITPKSVELSRYRLRKKLGLTHDENLYDFLLKYSSDE
jgi:DNA-binding CsgD family transcriptional regulator